MENNEEEFNEEEFMEYSPAILIQMGIERGIYKDAEDAFETFAKKYNWESKQEQAEAKEEHIRIWNKYKNKISKNGK